MTAEPRPNSFPDAAQATTGLTPAGIQPASLLAKRRWLVLTLNVTTWVLLMLGLAKVLAAGGWTVTDYVILICFAFGAPWTVLGFWNA
ncbi:MAG: glucans biosynthesis glucosyltransferase MdoH, partial [Bosea sp. (in: a-proteobacteria)]